MGVEQPIQDCAAGKGSFGSVIYILKTLSYQGENLDGNITLPLHPMGLKWAGLGRVSLYSQVGVCS